MNLRDIKQLVRDEGGKVFVAGEEKIDLVVLSYEEYLTLRSGKDGRRHEPGAVPLRREEEARSGLSEVGKELTIDDLPV